MARSRLSKRMEQKTKKNLLFSVLGIVLVIFLMFKFGIPLLVNLSLFISGSGKEEVKVQDSFFIAPPILDSMPAATSSANIIVTGFASKDQTVNLYINGELVDKTEANNYGTFSFEATIMPGENTIKTKTIADNKESEFSNTITTVLKSAPPSLSINSPANDQSFSKDQDYIQIRGTTDPDTKVTVNEFWAITDDSGNFSYSLLLQNGENKIKIIATDTAGNKTEKEIKVIYSP